jgi:hypothetical protein
LKTKNIKKALIFFKKKNQTQNSKENQNKKRKEKGVA